MKIRKPFLTPLLALALAGPLFAATPILRIAGAATYRPPIQKAIQDVLEPGYTFAYYGSGRYKPTAAVFSGTLASTGAAVIIKTYWTGDVSGIVDLTSQNNITGWIDQTKITLTGSAAGGTVLTGTYAKETSPSQAAVTITFPSSSAAVVDTAPGNGPTYASTINNADLIDAGSSNYAGGADTLGIAPIQWAVGKIVSGTVPFTNITQQQAYTLIQGPTPVAFFSGNSADYDKYVLLVGRSEDAGARTVPLAEAQTGFGQNVIQFKLTFSNNQTLQTDGTTQTGGAGSSITGAALWPANAPLNTEASINWDTQGHSGYTLTTDLVNVLSSTNPVAVGSGSNQVNVTLADPATAVYFVGYAGPADISGITGATALTYNGALYSVNAVQTGQYSLWSFAHLYYFNSGSYALTGVPQQAANDIADKIFTTDAPTNSSGVTDPTQASISSAGIFYNSSVLVTRSVEGGEVSANY